jgi:hypothetical protein
MVIYSISAQISYSLAVIDHNRGGSEIPVVVCDPRIHAQNYWTHAFKTTWQFITFTEASIIQGIVSHYQCEVCARLSYLDEVMIMNLITNDLY